MLADSIDLSQSGSLRSDVHLTAASKYELLDFVADELPRWRDRNDRNDRTSETALTSQLCAHLNSAARRSLGWDCLQFRVEEPDENQAQRRIDLVLAPCDATIWIDGRKHIDFDTIIPIECKRLPTPNGHERDEREYVFSKSSSVGGIQRFKAGHHASAHLVGAIIGYIQEETPEFWQARITQWIEELTKTGEPGWANAELPVFLRNDNTLRAAVLRSTHERANGLLRIELRHLWLRMN